MLQTGSSTLGLDSQTEGKSETVVPPEGSCGMSREQGRRGARHWGWWGLVDEQVSGSRALSARAPQRAMLEVSDVSPGLAPSLFWFLGIFNP